jgi:threonyl-tRNA synthetase
MGKKEVETASVSLRSRADGTQKSVTITELSNQVKKDVEGRPQLPSHLPRQLSLRPRFV